MELLRLVKRRLVNLAYAASESGLAAIGVPRPSVVLILGHMRSGSTLLLHLLLTNSRISSLGERNTAYAARSDLVRLAAETRFRTRKIFATLNYIADQVNHDRFTPCLSLLNDPRVRVIFLLRRPEASLASLSALSRLYAGKSAVLLRATDYYVTRLQFMRDLAGNLVGTGQAAFVTYEQLIDSPTQALARLQNFLRLAQGFSTEYEIQQFTRRRGDPGPNIGLGRITGNKSPQPSVVSAADSERATQAYVECRQSLCRLQGSAP